MKLVIGLWDKKAEMYLTPFFVGTVAVAYRDLQRVFRDLESPLSQFTEDFEVWHLATFDEESGYFDLGAGKDTFPVKLCDLTALKVVTDLKTEI